jgi:hypothetical protein
MLDLGLDRRVDELSKSVDALLATCAQLQGEVPDLAVQHGVECTR